MHENYIDIAFFFSLFAVYMKVSHTTLEFYGYLS